MQERWSVGILIFDNVEVLDFANTPLGAPASLPAFLFHPYSIFWFVGRQGCRRSQQIHERLRRPICRMGTGMAR